MALHHFGDAYSGFQAGIINGRVDHPIYFSNTERPETPPNPSAFIPFRRDPDFVDQETILDQIHHKCGRPGSRTALVGLGGVGKSQLAIEYAYRTREQSPETWIFWVHASSAARFEQSYRDIADHVKIPGRRNPSTNIFQLVHAWLCDEWRGQWILILDSVDDTGFLFDASTTGQDEPTNHVGGRRARQLVSYIPQSRNGSVLITTRSRRAARHLVEESDIVTVEPMTMGESLALIGKKLGKQDNMDSVVHLAAALEFLPLAIVQAAAYISKRSSRYSVRQYVEDFLKSDRKKASLLDFKDGQLRRDSDKSNSIIITWQISFDYIRHSRQSAANLLSLMSFFDRQEIPEALLRRRNEQANAQRDDKMGNAGDHGDEADDDHSNGDGDSDGSEYGDDEFEEDILTLREYSFISVIADRPSFKMHGLVQLATRKWLEAYGQQEEWNQRFIMNLDAELPTGEYENWVKCQALFPHAKSAVGQRPENKDSLKMWASILYKAAWYARGLGNWAEAEEMSVRAMNVRIKVLGQEHEDTLSSMSMVGLVYDLRGRWKEAEELFLHVLDSRKRVLGPEHPETLASMGNLASTYWNQGRWDAAEKLFIQVTEMREHILGAENPDTLTSMANLASTYRDQGQWKKAEKLEIYVTETQGRILGADHPSTLKCKAELALTLWNQGRRSDAEKLFVQGMEISKRVLGQEHPDTLSCMANLGMARRHRGKLTEAEELETRVLEVQQRILGAEHPSTLTSMANLASTFWSKGRWKDAEELLDQATEISKRVLGPEHPGTISYIANLAIVYRDQGKWQEAEELEVQAIETSKRVRGKEHPDTLTCMASLATTRRHQGRWHEAEGLEREVMEIRQRISGPKHPSTLKCMADLALTLNAQGQWKEAESLNMQTMNTSRSVMGDDHPDTFTSLTNLATSRWLQGQWAEAQTLEEQVMQSRKRVLGDEHPDTLTSMNGLALTYQSQGRLEDAESLESQVVEGRTRALGPEHPDTLSSKGNLASIYRLQKKWDEAEQLQRQVQTTTEALLGKEHPDAISSLSNLASIYWSKGLWKEAEKLDLISIKMRETALGKRHPETLLSKNNLSRTYHGQKRLDEAEKLSHEVWETMIQVLGIDHPHTLSAMAGLAQTWRSQGKIKEAVPFLEWCVQLREKRLGPEHPTSKVTADALAKWRYQISTDRTTAAASTPYNPSGATITLCGEQGTVSKPWLGGTMSVDSLKSSEEWFGKLDEFTSKLSIIGKREQCCSPTKIAILDTGVTEQCYEILKDYIKEYKDFVSNNDKLRQDRTEHGTTALRLLLKLYDDAEVYVGRIFEHKDADTETERLMAEAISHAKKQWKVDIICLPSGFNPDQFAPPYRTQLYNAVTATPDDKLRPRALIFAAASNLGFASNVTYPGCLSQSSKVLCLFSTTGDGDPDRPGFNPAAVPNTYNLSLLGESIRIDPQDKPIRGTSFSTIIAGAIAAHIIDFSKHPDTKDKIRDVWFLQEVEGMTSVFASMIVVKKNNYHVLEPWKLMKHYQTMALDREGLRQEICRNISKALVDRNSRQYL